MQKFLETPLRKWRRRMLVKGTVPAKRKNSNLQRSTERMLFQAAASSEHITDLVS